MRRGYNTFGSGVGLTGKQLHTLYDWTVQCKISDTDSKIYLLKGSSKFYTKVNVKIVKYQSPTGFNSMTLYCSYRYMNEF